MTFPPDQPALEFKMQHAAADIYPRFQLGYTGGPPSTADLNAAATLVREAFSTHLAAYLNSGLSMTAVNAYDLSNPATPFGVDGTAVPGTRTGSAPPLQVCAVINFGVNRRYRGSKPKVFLPFGSTSDFSGDRIWSGAFVADLTAAWIAFIGELTGEVAGSITLETQVCVSFYEGKEANPNPNSRLRFKPIPRDPALRQDVTSVAANAIFGSQRRRTRAV